jgi:hypothetical protein
MKERRIAINAYPLEEWGPRSYSIKLSLSERTPSKNAVITTVDDCRAALKEFAAEMESTGKPWHLSVSFDKHSGRKPAGFDKAMTARELECNVNTHLAKQRAA